MATYGATKRAVTYLTESLVKETKDSNVKVGFLSPGIVATDLLIDDYDGQPEAFEKARKIFNILGDRVETVTPWLADSVLAATEVRHPRRLADHAQGVRPLRDRRLQQARHLRGPTPGDRPSDGDRPVHRVRPGARARGLRPRAARRRRHRRARPGRRARAARRCACPRCSPAPWSPLGGLAKAIWKLLVAAEPCRDYPVLEHMLFPCLAFGFAGHRVGAGRASGAGRPVPWAPFLVLPVLGGVAALLVGDTWPLLIVSAIGAVTVGVLAILLARATRRPARRRCCSSSTSSGPSCCHRSAARPHQSEELQWVEQAHQHRSSSCASCSARCGCCAVRRRGCRPTSTA